MIQKYLDQINAITGRNDRLTETRLIRHFNENLLLPLPLVRDLTPDQYAQLVEQIPPPPNSPIQIHTDTARYYPYHELAAHLLGYAQNENLDPDELPNDGIKDLAFQKKVGRSGLEAYFNESLTGTTGSELWRVDPLGFQDTRLELQAPKQGEPLNISIDIPTYNVPQKSRWATEPVRPLPSTSTAVKSSPSQVTQTTTKIT